MAHVRDRRDADWFWMNKSVIDVYGAKIGVHGIAVYALLAKCANQEGHAIPSLRYMAQKLNIGTSTVQRYLEILVENKLIERQRRTSEHGDFTSTEYILLTIKNIDKGGVSVGDTPVPVENTPVSTADTGVFTGDTPVSAVNGQVYPQQIHGVSTVNNEQDFSNKIHIEQDPLPSVPPPRHRIPTKRSSADLVKTRPAKFVPENFTVTPELRTWALQEVPGLNIEAETNKMRDHEFKTPHSDWNRAWRNWMRTAWDRLPIEAKRPPSTQPQPNKVVL